MRDSRRTQCQIPSVDSAPSRAIELDAGLDPLRNRVRVRLGRVQCAPRRYHGDADIRQRAGDRSRAAPDQIGLRPHAEVSVEAGDGGVVIRPVPCRRPLVAEGLRRACGAADGDLKHRVMSRDSPEGKSDPLFDTTRCAAPEPAFAVRSGHDSARKFQFCRGLAEVLVSANSDALLTQARSDRQQRNRAFAAEFLGPATALRAG